MRVCIYECVSERACVCVTMGVWGGRILGLSCKQVKRTGDSKCQGLGDTDLE